MGQSSKRGAIVYEAETNYAEDVTTFATLRLPVVGMVDFSGLRHDKIDSDKVVQRRQDGSQWILATMGGSFKTKMSVPGHGSTTAGAVSASARETLLGRVIGNVAAAAASGTTFTGAGSATAPTTTASGTFSAGSLMKAGALSEARGHAQFHAISTHSGTTMTLLTGMNATPSAADICYAPIMLYPSENPLAAGTTVPSNRFLLQGPDLTYECHGCVPTAWELTGQNDGEVLHVEVTWEVAWWRYSTTTFPSAVASDAFIPAANAAGSLFVTDVGTATRAVRTCRDFKIEWTLGIELLFGPGGVSQYQKLLGAVRTNDKIKVSWTEDADAPTTTPVLPGFGTATTGKQILRSWTTPDGKATAFYAPNFCVTNVPIQFDDSGITRLRIEGECYTGTDTASDLTASAGRLALA